MVAAEMGREARGEEEEPASPVEEDRGDESYRASAACDAGCLLKCPGTCDEPWYLLLAGLLTRAVLEGYLTAGWRGPDAVDCLLKVGLGLGTPQQGDAPGLRDDFAQFDPDELPSLLDTARMLFPAALRDGNAANKGLAEEEFEMEMETR
ncbi:hypothetical protein C8R47DRAFT_1209855 [Mycena vitilis]|nr:hypothetical protein C8R47DRAFT_1209855 [Mycena vitilis]